MGRGPGRLSCMIIIMIILAILLGVVITYIIHAHVPIIINLIEVFGG